MARCKVREPGGMGAEIGRYGEKREVREPELGRCRGGTGGVGADALLPTMGLD